VISPDGSIQGSLKTKEAKKKKGKKTKDGNEWTWREMVSSNSPFANSDLILFFLRILYISLFRCWPEKFLIK
jgi:hypothetical protein